ncbi:hypothetical protein JYK04_02071 [Streptomyces nojiriensis]|nr:hypothetical protein JYK04_02048 [Streptomyces nojiriensis]QTI44303.1 hypothetical protein JYK04_02071 [Streptomyces nojiriensis]
MGGADRRYFTYSVVGPGQCEQDTTKSPPNRGNWGKRMAFWVAHVR